MINNYTLGKRINEALGAFVKSQGGWRWKGDDFYLELPKTCCRIRRFIKSMINYLCYCRREIMPELMFKGRSLHQIGSLIMSEFAFRASKEEVAHMNKLSMLLFSLSAAAVMSNAV